MLTAEPGLDAWWHTVVQIMAEVYRAERVTLAVPADSTDIENVPWGQKATYNVHRGDGLSMGYLARDSSMISRTVNETPDAFPIQRGYSFETSNPERPGLQSRHSFTSYEDRTDKKAASDRTPSSLRRPGMRRSKTTHVTPSTEPDAGVEENNRPLLNRETLEEHDAIEEQRQIPSWEAAPASHRDRRGKLLDVLQALDYEADPLIDHNGVVRVLDRGRVVALTRSYPYFDERKADTKTSDSKPAAHPVSPEGARRKIKRQQSDSVSKLSTILKLTPASGRPTKSQTADKKTAAGTASMTDDERPRPPTPRYEEYEQAPPSPWSQSPAPSPAIRPDPADNPFFTDAMVDEESFNPSPGPSDYTAMKPPEAIGVDNAWTVLHIPLSHVLLSKPSPSFRLDSAALEEKLAGRPRFGDTAPVSHHGTDAPSKGKHAPIAILSILSPIIPYPSTLRYSLEHLAPHLATSFSLARHYTNMEIELNGLQKRRPATAGFGALGPDGRPLADANALASMGYFPTEDVMPRDSMGKHHEPERLFRRVSRRYRLSRWDPRLGGIGLGVCHGEASIIFQPCCRWR